MARLIDTKLQPPRLRQERVRRPRVYESLGNLEDGLVLVSAPPGFGKSTMVAEWLETEERPFAWYSLDRFDAEPGLFGEYLAAAVGSLTGRGTGSISVPGEPTLDTRTLTAMLAKDLNGAPSRATLVLDDYHEIDGRAAHEVAEYFVDHLPDGLVLVIITRADPALPLSRLRSQGRLHDIRGSDLRFTEAEIGEYFSRGLGIDLNEQDRQIVANRSDGWVSALQLVSLGLDQQDPAGVVDALSSEHPHIAGYLLDEVLGRLDPDLASFLVESATFDRFDAALCRTVMKVDEADAVIDEIERRNAFLIPLGGRGGWYRYHYLFAELLRSRLKRVDPDRQISLLRTAALACDQRGLPDDAIDCALRADDLPLAAAIADRHAEAALGAGQIARLRSWLLRFPVPAGPAAHVIVLGWAWCRIFEGNLEAASKLLDQVETEHLEDFEQDLRPQLDIMRAMVAFHSGDTGTAERLAQEGLDALQGPSAYLECLGHLYIGRALHARACREEARPHLERAASLAVHGNTFAAVSALFWLGAVDGDTGRLEAAERSMRRAQQVAATAASGDSSLDPALGFADIGLAYMRLNQLDAPDAIRLAERGSRSLEYSMSVEMMFRAFFVWAEALSLAGRFDDSEAIAEEGAAWLRGRNLGGGPLEAWLWLSQTRNRWRWGQLDEAGEMLQRVLNRGLGGSNEDETSGFYEAATELSYTLRRGQVDKSQRLLAELPPGAEGNVMFAIERRVLTAAVAELSGESRDAVAAMEQAADLAHEGYRYQFSHVGPVVLPVLKRMVGRTSRDGFIRSVIDLLPAEGDRLPRQPVDALTAREVDVLTEIAAGYTNAEIADRLFISRGTVKRHTSNIYLKLGVHHRTEAAAKGRRLGLIP